MEGILASRNLSDAPFESFKCMRALSQNGSCGDLCPRQFSDLSELVDSAEKKNSVGNELADSDVKRLPECTKYNHQSPYQTNKWGDELSECISI